MIQFDMSDHRPLYEQIKERMKELIITGVLNPEDKIPSVRELASQLTINPNTIQRAYRDLEAEGYIYSVRAKGSFVAPSDRAESRAEMDTLTDTFISLVRQAKYFGITEGALTDKIAEIYKEDR